MGSSIKIRVDILPNGVAVLGVRDRFADNRIAVLTQLAVFDESKREEVTSVLLNYAALSIQEGELFDSFVIGVDLNTGIALPGISAYMSSSSKGTGVKTGGTDASKEA